MNQSQKQYAELRLLICQSEEGNISLEDMQKLNNILLNDPQARKYYQEYIHTNVILQSLYTTEQFNFKGSTQYDPEKDYMVLFSELALYEKTAPEIALSEEKLQPELIQKVVYEPREKYKLTGFHKFSLAACAAVILFFVYLRFAPQQPYSMDVATLVDQVDVQWGPSEMALDTGSRLWTKQGRLSLKKGVVNILYDDGVSVLIEGPASFEIEQSRVLLDYGRIYSRVSETGLGFTIKTPTSQFVDMGTEFGVQADVNGSSELHVIKGEVQLFAGLQKGTRAGKMVTANNAVKYDVYKDRIANIEIEKEAFVRHIDSRSGVIWRGQQTIDLADVVGGGNGLGTGVFGAGINLINGEYVEEFDTTGYYTGTNNYMPVVSNPFIDGVFVPDGGEQSVQISSQNHYFKECPDTNGTFWVGIKSRGQHEVQGDIKRHALTLQGVPYDSPDRTAIFMHANQGITFDLHKIREFYPSFDIARFTAIFGLSDSMANPNVFEGGAVLDPLTKVGSYWVLIDGELRASKSGLNPTDAPISIDIAITEKDRFLTLVATADIIDHVWSLFAKPMLHMRQSE